MVHSKSGCRTCRSRKLKCDEGRPACRKCVSTGRLCGGYGIWGGGGNTYTHRPLKLTLGKSLFGSSPFSNVLSRASEEECLYLEWFHNRTTKKLTGAFVTMFWDTLIHQSIHETAVLHAVLALSCIHKKGTLEGNMQHPARKFTDETFVLQHYNEAMVDLGPRLAVWERQSLRVTLITCVIFVCLDYLRGNPQFAKLHLDAGLKLVTALRNATSSTHSSSTTPSRDPADDWIEEAFIRLYVQRSLFLYFSGDLEFTYRPLYIVEELPSAFHTYNMAWRHLENLYCRIFYIFSEQQSRYLQPVSAQNTSYYHREQDDIQIELAKWLQIYTSSSPSLTRHEPTLRAQNLLFEYHEMARIMVAICLSTPGDEMIHDNHTEGFLAILRTSIKLWTIRAVTLIKLPQKPTVDMSRSIVDIGWLPPLYFTALKCRVRRIRWHAIRLLERTFHKEGIWDSRLCARVARTVVQLEEADLYSANQPSLEFALDDVPDLMNMDAPILFRENRISQVKIDLPQEYSTWVTLHLKQRGAWRSVQVEVL